MEDDLIEFEEFITAEIEIAPKITPILTRTAVPIMTQRFRRNSHVCFLSSHQLTSRSCTGRTGAVTLTTLSIFLSWEFVLSFLVFFFLLVSFFHADILLKLTHEYFFR